MFLYFSFLLLISPFYCYAGLLRSRERSSEERCGRDYEGISRGTVLLPTYPKRFNDTERYLYKSLEHCYWNIVTGKPGVYVMLTSEVFKLETSEDCLRDYVEISEINEKNQVVVTNRFCGWDPVTYISATNRVKIEFRSDESYEDQGFSFKYETKLTAEIDSSGCNSAIQGPMPGEVRSTDTPCYYSIRAGEGEVIEIDLTEIDFGNRSCDQESIKIFKGYSGQGKPLVTLCNNASTGLIGVRKSVFFIAYNKDGDFDSNGFKIAYTFVVDNFSPATDPSTTDEKIGADRAPTVRIEPQFQTVKEGEPVRFNCIATGTLQPTVEWYRGGNRPLNPEATVTSDGLFTIPWARPDDEADYYCKATNKAGTTEIRTILYVTKGETQSYQVYVRETRVVTLIGQTARLECYSGYAAGRTILLWSRQNAALPPRSSQEGGLLTIPNVQPSYAGNYVCMGTITDTGRVNTAVTRLDVDTRQEKVAPTVRVEPEKLIIPMGTTGTLRCIATGSPEPQFTWLKSREELSSNHQVTGNVLRITQTTMGDRGIYVCRAENVAGSNQGWAIVEVERRVRPKLEMYPNTTQRVRTGASAMFQCRVMDGAPPPTVTWSRVGNLPVDPEKVEIMENGVIMFKQVTRAQQGSYVCTATNDMGTITITATLIVEGPPSITLQPGQTVYAHIGQRVTLECIAEGDPTPSVYWIEPAQPGRGDPEGIVYDIYEGPAVLNIASIQREDQGYYKCVASNTGGTTEESLKLIACDCKGMSDECYFDEELYNKTGHGGHCINCRDNRRGVHCEQCLQNHYINKQKNHCTPCNCDETGSEDLQCDEDGQCLCKPGVTGQYCERCEDNYYEFNEYGCRPFGCFEDGSINNYPERDSETGQCVCKEFVEGQNCDRCKPGYFGLESDNPYGCVSCFCSGHSSICTNATGYFTRSITSDFKTGKQHWTGVDRRNEAIEIQYNGILQNLGISAPEGNDFVFFSAPARYLGDQRFSYNQFFTYKLRIGEEQATASILDVVIEGAGHRISTPFYSQGNPIPGLESQEYKFRLHEHPSYQWIPQLKAETFISILSNITAIKIRATYNRNGVGFIDDIHLGTASQGFDDGIEATWVEICTCPEGYMGQFCESCAPGFKREPAFGGMFAVCVPCQCINHFELCDADSGCEPCMCHPEGSLNSTCDLVTGQCQCKPGVNGRNCNQCEKLHYGFGPVGCTACNCDPEGSLDMQCDDYGFCPCISGVEGRRCERCMENKYNIRAGCIDSPPCYRLHVHRGKVRELNNPIMNIGIDPDAFTDTQFTEKMGRVIDSINILLNEARGASTDDGTMGHQLQMLCESIQDVLSRCGQITSNIITANTRDRGSLQDIMKAEEAIERAKMALKAADNNIDGEGPAALQRAKNALDKLGQQSSQMTDIATKAKEMTMRQLEEAKRIKMLSKKALENFKEALQLAKDTLQMPGSIMQEIQALRMKANDPQRLYEQTKFFAEKALNKSMAAYEQTLNLYTQVLQILIPGVDLAQLMAESDRIKNEAADIRKETGILIEQNENLLTYVAHQRVKAQAMLNSGIKHQQKADKLMEKVYTARAMASNAVEQGERRLRVAINILTTLLGFNHVVQDTKGKADDALKSVPDIEALIEEAERETQEARDTLSGAEKGANDALSIAEEAENTAHDASYEASRIRTEAENIETRVVGLKDDADSLAADIADTDDQIGKFNVQAENDSDLATEALNKAGHARQTAQDAAAKVADVLAKVENIRSTLSSLFEPDADELDRLEITMAAVEQELQEAALEDQFTKLTTTNNQVKKWVIDYRLDINDLEADVENVREIKESSPTGCFKNIEILTPTSQ